MERREEKVTIEITFHANMPIDDDAGERESEEIGDNIVDVLQREFVDPYVARESFAIVDWRSEAVTYP